jgi:hypothetical protein
MNTFGEHFSILPTADTTLCRRQADCAVCSSHHASPNTTPDCEKILLSGGIFHYNSQKSFFSPAERSASLKNRFSARRNFPLFQKPFFSPAELPAFSKKRFSTRRNSPILQKTFFQPGGTLRFFKKRFFSPAELPAFSKKRFSARRNFPILQKIIFQPGGTSRRANY